MTQCETFFFSPVPQSSHQSIRPPPYPPHLTIQGQGSTPPILPARLNHPSAPPLHSSSSYCVSLSHPVIQPPTASPPVLSSLYQYSTCITIAAECTLLWIYFDSSYLFIHALTIVVSPLPKLKLLHVCLFHTVVCIILVHLMIKYKFKYLPESISFVLIGELSLSSPNQLTPTMWSYHYPPISSLPQCTLYTIATMTGTSGSSINRP